MQNLATKFENLTIQSDFIFKKVMSRKRICIHLLEELLQIKIADISYFEAEKSLEPDYASRGIRLDIIVFCTIVKVRFIFNVVQIQIG